MVPPVGSIIDEAVGKPELKESRSMRKTFTKLCSSTWSNLWLESEGSVIMCSLEAWSSRVAFSLVYGVTRNGRNYKKLC